MEILNLGNRVVNTYLVKLSDGYLLIDTGYHEQFTDFCKKAKAHNIDLDKIKYVFLTHAHDDHAGYINEILMQTNAKIILHNDALIGLRRGQNSFNGGCSSKLALYFCKVMGLFGKGEHKFPPIMPKYENRCIIINDNNKSDLEKQIGGKIVETPGHTECSISLLMNNGTLFCGDAAMNGFPSMLRATIWIGNLNEYCDSWRKIISLNPQIIYPSHGKPFHVSDLKAYLPKISNFKLYPLVKP